MIQGTVGEADSGSNPPNGVERVAIKMWEPTIVVIPGGSFVGDLRIFRGNP